MIDFYSKNKMIPKPAFDEYQMILAIQTSKELQIFSITRNTKNFHKNNIPYEDPVFIIQLELLVEDCTALIEL